MLSNIARCPAWRERIMPSLVIRIWHKAERMWLAQQRLLRNQQMGARVLDSQHANAVEA
jgi:hypothetical protein